jgi:hypothetical protein
MPRELAIAAGCGLAAALFHLSVLTGSPSALVFVYLTQFPLFVAGLWLGVKAAIIAGATATAASLIVGDAWSTLFFLIADAMPVAILVRQALLWRTDEEGRVWWYPPGRLVVWWTGIGVVALLGGAIALSGGSGGLAGAVHDLAAADLARFFGGSSGRADALVAATLRLFPAMAISSWLLMVVFNGVLAQGVLARFGLNRRPSPEIAEIELPHWVPAPVAAAGLAAVFGAGNIGYLGTNLLPILGLAFVFAGLAVVHAAVRRLKVRGPALMLFYIVLMLGWPILLVGALGFIEQWAGLRQRFALAALGRGDK